MPVYQNISLPKEMYDQIEKLIKEHPELGFTSVPEFIKSAIREYAHYREASRSDPDTT